MSAELLRRAAKVLREHAEGATPGPWRHVDYADPEGQPLTSDGQQSTFMGCGSIITMTERLIGGDIAMPHPPYIAGPSGDCYPRGGYSPKEDMAFIALMHPPVALALAEWLDHHADDTDEIDRSVTHRAAAVARAILREES